MDIINSPERTYKTILKYKLKKRKIGFVPTMGALHDGHFLLIKRARIENDIVVVSIFVNPKQFEPGEDFNTYPKPKKEDIEKCKKAKVDIVFYPKADFIYPYDYLTYVNVSDISKVLCGKFRPNHFKGVATIVLKLFNIIIPDIAYFGLKDYQQYIIIKKMVNDLNLHIKIKGMPIIREKDGIAMSSRNKYLNNEERQEALLISKSLFYIKKRIKSGEKRVNRLIKEIYRFLLSGRLIKRRHIDYISIVDPDNLGVLNTIDKHCVVAIAVKVGKARLIDNIII